MSDLVLKMSLPYLLGIVAAGTGVSLRTDPNAKTASTNGEVVILPPLPYQGGELAIYALGFIIHEAGHLRNTDFSAVGERITSPLMKMLVNILEDVRIERLIQLVFPGARHWLNALTKKFVEKSYMGVIDPDVEATRQLTRYLMDWLFGSVLGYPALQGIGEQQRTLWRNRVSPTLADQIEKLALSAVYAQSTHQVVDVAEQIVALLQGEMERANAEQQSQEREQQPETGGGNESTQQADPDPEEGAGTDESAGPAEGDEEPIDSLPGGDCDQDAGNLAPSGEPPAGETDSPSADKLREYAQTLSDILASPELDEAADRGDRIRGEMSAAVGTMKANLQSTFALPRVSPATGVKSDPNAIGRVRAASTALRQRMEEFLQARTQRRFSSSEKGKRLSRDAFRRIALGDPRVFQRRTEGSKVDTAVHVLIDISTSMADENRCTVALDAALALGMALDDVEGVKYSVSAFPFHSNDVVELVNPGESIRDVAHRFKSMSPNGSTPLDKALIQAHTLLMTTQAKRRVCLVITDGAPDDVDAMRLIAKMGEDDGIEHLAIGIRCSVGHISKNSCVVTDLADLPKEVMAMMQSVVLAPTVE